MPTVKQMIDSVSNQLHGFGQTQDRVTPLATSIGASDTVFTVTATFGQSVGIAPGICEIDSEQVYVQNVDQATGNCTLATGFGRGYHGTTATSHSAGALVISRPLFPRLDIFNEMNNVLGGVFPDLFVPETFETTVQYPTNTYTVPGNLDRPADIIDIQWQHPIGSWIRMKSYSVDPYDGTIRLGDFPMLAVGRPLRVVYAAEPQLLSAETDDFADQTGLPVSSADVLIYGTLARLALAFDISRAGSTSVEQSQRGTSVPPNAGINIANFLGKEFQMRLDNEAQTLRRFYKPRIVRRY